MMGITLSQQRKLINNLALGLSLGAMIFGLFWLAWILWTTLDLGIAGLSWNLLTKMTPPPKPYRPPAVVPPPAPAQ